MPAPPRKAFEERVDAWLIHLHANQGRAPSTVHKYRRFLERLRDWCATPPEDPRRRASTRDPLELTDADIETFAGLHAHAEGLSPRARRPLVSALRGFYAWCAKAYGTRDLAEHLPVPKVGRTAPLAATLHHVEQLLMAPDIETLDGLRDAAVIAMLAGCAPRISGLVGLNESSLLWTIEDGREKLYVTLIEKGANVRHVPAPPEVAMLVRAYLAHPELQAIDRTVGAGDRVLFVSLRAPRIKPHDYHGEKRRMSQRGVRRMLRARAQAAGVPLEYAHPHALRHLFGAELAEDDTPLLQHQALMGHSDPKHSEIYAHLARRKLRSVVEKSNPLRKIRTPLLDTLRTLADRATVGR